jgi:hypothetical protein
MKPGYAELRVLDDRANLTLNVQAFSSSNYTGTLPNPTPTGENPNYSVFKTYPPRDIIARLIEYATGPDSAGRRSTSLGFEYITITDDGLFIGDKITWDPDITLLFSMDQQPEPSQAPVDQNAVAIGVGVSFGIVGLAAITVGVLAATNRKVRRAIFPFAMRKDDAESGVIAAPLAQATAPSDAFNTNSEASSRSSNRASWSAGDRKSVMVRNTVEDS